ncbi:DMT family transporter [Leeuwenhoekiella nanhaiensis]|uniref:Permease n=1 Tax=Leeuwenhoekiella nanhaiensis TaxID=1655491 RepID=A0A2G1VTJ8_9FLAO|nr:EamA family transporter [Leeuwenhoekiella nanhaiensis]PHQ29759.1 permease [Leeuwenhoekiella nanhaiensis]
MQNDQKKWLYLIILSLVWGSSYILIKKSLEGFSPFQLGAIRIIFSTAFLFAIGFNSLKTITRAQWPWVALSALCGTFLPVFLFSFAETQIDSSIVSVLNSLVPLFTILIGYFAFKVRFSGLQLAGVLVGLAGAALLIFNGASVNPDQNYWFAGLVIFAALCYGANANIIKAKLQDVSSKAIAVGNFAVMILPALLVGFFAGLPEQDFSDDRVFEAVLYVALLSVVGTGIAKILFNRLIQISSPVFSTSVTYLIPVVGIFWGILDGEQFTRVHGVGALVILGGVYLVNRSKKREARA